MRTYLRNADPFKYSGGQAGCLLIHGLAGSPAEMRPLGEFLAKRGLTVVAPLLAGHGTSPDDLALTRWPDWHGSAEKALLKLSGECCEVHLIGFSMGGTIALHLSAHHPVASVTSLAGAMFLANRALFLVDLLQYVVPHIPSRPSNPDVAAQATGYDRFPLKALASLRGYLRVVRRELPTIEAPALIVQGRLDRAVDARSALYIHEHVGSREKRLLWLERGGHMITLERGREKLFAEVAKFIRTHSRVGE